MEALKGFFFNDGQVNAKAVKEIMPDNFHGSIEEFAYRVASTFRLSPDFIEENFERLHLRSLFIVNRVDENTIITNARVVAKRLLEELELVLEDDEEETDLAFQFMLHEYDSRVYDLVFGYLFDLLDRLKEEEGEMYDELLEHPLHNLINSNVNLFSREFIIRNLGQYRFDILHAAIVRRDLDNEIELRIKEVPFEALCRILLKFEALDITDEGEKIYTEEYTQEREEFVKKLFFERLLFDMKIDDMNDNNGDDHSPYFGR